MPVATIFIRIAAFSRAWLWLGGYLNCYFSLPRGWALLAVACVRGGSALCHKILVGPRSASATAASMRLSWSSGIDAVERWRLPCPRIAQ